MCDVYTEEVSMLGMEETEYAEYLSAIDNMKSVCVSRSRDGGMVLLNPLNCSLEFLYNIKLYVSQTFFQQC